MTTADLMLDPNPADFERDQCRICAESKMTNVLWITAAAGILVPYPVATELT